MMDDDSYNYGMGPKMDNDFLKEVAEDKDIVLPKEDSLGRLTSLARWQLEVQEIIEGLERDAANWKEVLKKVSERDIPELMMEIGAREIKLLDGRKLTIKPFYSGKITSDEAYEWLEANGYGDIIKVAITIKTTASDEERTTQIRKLLHDNAVDWDETQGVHSSTLNAFIKETISSGKPIDRPLFNVYTGWRTSIK